MITHAFINEISEFSKTQAEKYKLPSLFHLDLAKDKGQELAIKLNADSQIVLLGTLLMDCMLGPAFEQSKMNEHIQMSAEKAKELLKDDSQVNAEEKENIINCIEQHHGAEKFYSMESEICCNSDCYRFASVKGFLGGLINGPSIPTDKRIGLFFQKADEKWGLVSLDICKQELKPQFDSIKSLLSQYKIV